MKFLKAIVLLTSFVFSTSVWAHAELISSSPVKEAMLHESPTKLVLSFSAPVRLVRLELRDKSNKAMAIEKPSMKKSQADYSLKLPPLADSTYTVSWVMMGEDGHKMTGQFDFMVHTHTATHH